MAEVQIPDTLESLPVAFPELPTQCAVCDRQPDSITLVSHWTVDGPAGPCQTVRMVFCQLHHYLAHLEALAAVRAGKVTRCCGAKPHRPDDLLVCRPYEPPGGP
ncbi:hypothetical protein GCM10025790_20500 [Nesterenkonia rhizosphaerae]|uniref:Uncharacterized protein n=1 Tax=Nesterenkonia rhizosphaerae TaxID=1348272 RepID=A0ABP9G0M0_9MICC